MVCCNTLVREVSLCVCMQALVHDVSVYARMCGLLHVCSLAHIRAIDACMRG
jgi:hypothetical protein